MDEVRTPPPSGRQTGSVKEESGLRSLTTFHLAPQSKEALQVLACSAPALVRAASPSERPMDAGPPRRLAESFRLLSLARCSGSGSRVGGKRACFSRPRWKETRGIRCRSKLFVIEAEEL